MEYSTIAFLWILCFTGSFIQRVTGFGFGIFVMTMLPYILPSYGESTALSGTLAGSMSLIVAWRMRRHIVWKELLPILITFVVVSLCFVFAVSSMDEKFLKKILGAILICVSVYFFFISEKIKLKPSLPAQIGLGSFSGMMGGLFAMQGPPAVLYFLASSETKEKYIAQTQTYFIIGNAMMTIFRAKAGFVTAAVGSAYCYGLVAVCLGALIGSKVSKKIPHAVLKKIVYMYMAISGVIALVA